MEDDPPNGLGQGGATASPDPLIDAVLTIATADHDLPDEAKYLVLAALEGDADLCAALDGRSPGEQVGTDRAPETGPDPAGAFLRSVTVTGFRGIGPPARLSLHPAAGLTVVAGRNGSGKSTFAEALEVALTTTSYRWRDRSAAWQRDWANLHSPKERRVRVELAEEGAGTTTVGVDWDADASRPEELRTWVQRPGTKVTDGVASLGWAEGIELYRPLLSYEELGGLLTAAPGKLYDELSKILGLERMVEAQARLDARLAEAAAPVKARKAAVAELKKLLASVLDARAEEALTILKRRVLDRDGLRRLAVGSVADPGTNRLQAIADLTVPDAAAVEQVRSELLGAVKIVAEHTASLGAGDIRRTELLRRALDFAVEHSGSDMACPVCGAGTLDAAWRAAVMAELAEQDTDQKQLRRARGQLDNARTAAQRLLAGVPPLDGTVELTSLPRARAATTAWHDHPDDDASLAEHLRARYADLAGAFDAVRTEARAELLRRADAWAPIATRIVACVDLADRAAEVEASAQLLETACGWLRRNAELLRNQRLAPLADQARGIWAVLRQESNVDIRSITLPRPKGRNKQVEITAEVDGSAAGALGVMSTGELHALALALFLPRATRPESPFRFIVLDDPIQAMDPSKIDGFVQVLRDLATIRQVVVFSHDDRLPEAVRRLVRDARILEVCRSPRSQVAVVEADDPAGRDISDALALCCDPGVPPEVVARIVPRLCRSAFETAARDAYFARALTAGVDRHIVEKHWNEAANQPQRLALALYRDHGRSVEPWLRGQPWRRPALDTCGRGVHQGFRTQPKGLVDDVKKLVADLKAAP